MYSKLPFCAYPTVSEDLVLLLLNLMGGSTLLVDCMAVQARERESVNYAKLSLVD